MGRGALFQMVTLGYEDVHLIGNPQITFWKHVYKKHTHFAIEHISQEAHWNYPNAEYTISRNADLIHKCYLRIIVPPLIQPENGDADENYISYINKFGHAFIESVTLKIGGKVIDTQTGEFIDIWNELTLGAAKQDVYSTMIGSYEENIELKKQYTSRVYYIPLLFFFCNHPGSALPLVALGNHVVEINFKFKQFDDLIQLGSSVTHYADDQNTHFIIDLFVDYIYLDNDERLLMAQTMHEMLITQVKKIDHTMNNDESTRIPLSLFSHPVKEIIWVAKEVDEYDKPLKLLKYHTHDEIMQHATLVLDDEIRINRESAYYRYIQPFQHHTRIPNDYIYVYSFSLKPENESQPSGTCNFSRLQYPYLKVINKNTLNKRIQYTIYALNWNILHIQGGQAGVVFR